MMNKRGEIVLRDIMFMLVTFSSLLLLMSLFVIDMSAEYENIDMATEYSSSGNPNSTGSSLLADSTSSLTTMYNQTNEAAGSFGTITGFIGGVGTILKMIILSPVYIGDAITSLMISLNVPTIVSNIVGNLIIFGVYIVIIFVIVSALSRGGTKL